MAESLVFRGADDENADSVSDVDKCYICLSPFEQQTVASLDSCQHVFCLHCILLWSQTANTCPVDRTSFTIIHQRQSPGGQIQKKIKVRPKKNEGDEEEGSSPVVCEECGRSDRTHHLLVCLHCDSGYHMNCLTPSLSAGPEGDWICPDCVIVLQQTEDAVLEEEISDGELTDLLAEVEEAASTSSRLRPSTVTRPIGSTERRHSARIQSRAERSPRPSRPRAHWHVPKYLIRASRPAATSEAASSSKITTRKRRKRSA
ncbi:PHD and RING finger domain-containing protein 1-like [Salarias fasciatus]|uniref:PHD and RING finger domain-containing protein 1-like n=1 Tax=Salarias fasciatus TaxID=181472 RepID=UPI0011766F43|nr:PHD and RING finger domain-containing protein 1-like [Salarias fasciatus]